jgi:predicted RNA-binding protein with PIN domain
MRDLIVDGYNVLHAVPRYRDLMSADLGLARARLVDDLASYAAGAWRATVVFDGVSSDGETDPGESVAGVRVMFAAADSEADAVVAALARVARDDGREIVVVSSDASTVWTVLGRGVTRMSPRALASAMKDETRERADIARGSGRAATLDGRVDAQTRSGLLRLRDGSD